MHRSLPALFAFAALSPAVTAAQQVGDESFRFANERPAFATGTGPAVCIDEGHHNFHTADGRYRTFAELLRADGYVVTGHGGAFSAGSLRGCALLVIANALAEANAEDWTYPHPSAFSKAEIEAVMAWVRGGGSLLIFADHAPFAAAARDLGAVFGVAMTDAYVDGEPGGPDIFRIGDRTLRGHAILTGRSPAERVDSVMTFTGQAMQLTEGWQPILVFGPDAVARINNDQTFRAGEQPWPGFAVGGWVHGAARAWDAGRAVFLGEAAMCSAQLAGPQRSPMGMNDPRAAQNAQFCLNAVRWLTRVIEP